MSILNFNCHWWQDLEYGNTIVTLSLTIVLYIYEQSHHTSIFIFKCDWVLLIHIWLKWFPILFRASRGGKWLTLKRNILWPPIIFQYSCFHMAVKWPRLALPYTFSFIFVEFKWSLLIFNDKVFICFLIFDLTSEIDCLLASACRERCKFSLREVVIWEAMD